jgi:hypothetical protein
MYIYIYIYIKIFIRVGKLFENYIAKLGLAESWIWIVGFRPKFELQWPKIQNPKSKIQNPKEGPQKFKKKFMKCFFGCCT